MTDNEIIKALGYCVSHDECGADCPCFSGKLEMCGDREGLLKQCLDLINRQKAEVERLKEELDGETVKNMRLGHEIEQWEEEANRYQNLWCEAMKDIQTAKSEAIKEFAEKLKDYHKNYEGYCVVDDDDIDNLVAEMTEGRRMGEWISVNERLPDKISNYLVHYIHSYSTDDGYWALGIVYFNGSYFSWHDNAYRITHWMPLPEPPKE